MKKLLTLISFFLFPFFLYAQGNIMLMPFGPLMNAEWKAEGKWKDGTPFRQEVNYNWADNEQSVKKITKSYLDTTFTGFGQFSESIYTWDTISNSIQFAVKDIHGKVIGGTVHTKQNTILYEYSLEDSLGVKTYMTDALIWIKPDKYMFKSGILKADEWQEVLLEVYFFKK